MRFKSIFKTYLLFIILLNLSGCATNNNHCSTTITGSLWAKNSIGVGSGRFSITQSEDSYNFKLRSPIGTEIMSILFTEENITAVDIEGESIPRATIDNFIDEYLGSNFNLHESIVKVVSSDGSINYCKSGNMQKSPQSNIESLNISKIKNREGKSYLEISQEGSKLKVYNIRGDHH